MEEDTAPEETLRRLRALTLSAWEEAPLLQEYIRKCRITQSECAARLGRSQASVANRLRLLQLPEPLRRAMQDAKLTERHARALLRLPAAQRESALREICAAHLSVSETESLVESLLHAPEPDGLHALRTEIRRLLAAGICESAAEDTDGARLVLTLSFSRRDALRKDV